MGIRLHKQFNFGIIKSFFGEIRILGVDPAMFKFNKYRRLFQASSKYYTASSVRGQGEPNTPL